VTYVASSLRKMVRPDVIIARPPASPQRLRVSAWEHRYVSPATLQL
jgi:hypothetical protein